MHKPEWWKGVLVTCPVSAQQQAARSRIAEAIADWLTADSDFVRVASGGGIICLKRSS